jgi:hypothetical protein
MKELKLFYEACCLGAGMDLSSQKRNNELAYARFVYFYKAKKLFPTISNSRIGALAGGRDNATVIHGIKRYIELKGYSDFEDIKKSIEKEIRYFNLNNKTKEDFEIKYLYSNKARLEHQVELLNKRIVNTAVEKEILEMFNQLPKEKLIDFKETRLKPYLKMNSI